MKADTTTCSVRLRLPEIRASDDEAVVRARLAQDPWPEELLTIESIRPWSV